MVRAGREPVPTPVSGFWTLGWSGGDIRHSGLSNTGLPVGHSNDLLMSFASDFAANVATCVIARWEGTDRAGGARFRRRTERRNADKTLDEPRRTDHSSCHGPIGAGDGSIQLCALPLAVVAQSWPP